MLQPILTSQRGNQKATLAISSLVHSYCRLHDDCGAHQEVRDIISVLEDHLRYNCKTQTDQLHNKVRQIDAWDEIFAQHKQTNRGKSLLQSHNLSESIKT